MKNLIKLISLIFLCFSVTAHAADWSNKGTVSTYGVGKILSELPNNSKLVLAAVVISDLGSRTVYIKLSERGASSAAAELLPLRAGDTAYIGDTDGPQVAVIIRTINKDATVQIELR